MHTLVLININWHTKFQLPSLIYSKNTIGLQNIKWVTSQCAAFRAI